MAVHLLRLRKGQEPLQVVNLKLEVRHVSLAHGPLKLGRVHVGVRVPETCRGTCSSGRRWRSG